MQKVLQATTELEEVGRGGGGGARGEIGGKQHRWKNYKLRRSNLCDTLTVKLQEVRASVCIKNSSPSMASSGS